MKYVKWGGVLVLLGCLGGVLYYYMYPAKFCAQMNQVWDGDEKRCRDDCLVWNEANGCVYLNEEHRALFEACADKTADCDEARLKELNVGLCHKYNAPINLKYGYCDLAFNVFSFVSE